MHIIAVVILISLLGAQARVAAGPPDVQPKVDDGEAVSSKELLSTNSVKDSVDDKASDSTLSPVVPNGDATAAPNAAQNDDSDDSDYIDDSDDQDDSDSDQYDSSESDKTTAAPTKAPTDPPTKAPTKAPTDPPTKAPTIRPTSAPAPVLPKCTWFNWWLFAHCLRWKLNHIFG